MTKPKRLYVDSELKARLLALAEAEFDGDTNRMLALLLRTHEQVGRIRESDTHRLYVKASPGDYHGDRLLLVGCWAEGCDYRQRAVFLSLRFLDALEANHKEFVDRG